MNRPSFYALMKDFNSGEIRKIDVIGPILDDILTKRGTMRKVKVWDGNEMVPITTRESLFVYMNSEFRYRYWSNATVEAVVIDWPYRNVVDPKRDGMGANLISINRPVKLDVYDQLEPNMDVIVDLVWRYISGKIK